MDGKHAVCTLRYRKGNQPYVSYVLYADDDSGLITGLFRRTWIKWNRFNEGKTYYETTTFREDTVQLDSDIGQKIDQMLLRFPEPKPNYSDGHSFASPLHINNYDVSLYAKYGEKWYQYGRHLSFRMSYTDFDLWLSLVKRLLVIFEDLTGNINQLRPTVEDKVDAYHDAFHKKGKHSKYQRRWTEPQLDDWVYHHVSYAHFFDDFTDEDLSIDELRQLDYRHYLSSFLWVIAFQKTVVLYPPKPIDAMIVFQRLSETHILSWDIDEQDALRDYFDALWDYVLTYYPPLGIDAFTFVHGVGLTGFDVTPYVKQWKSSMDDISASRHLAGYVRSLYELYTEDGTGVFDTVPKILRRWLREVGEGDYFLKRYMEYDGVRPFAEEFAQASDVLNALLKEGL